MNKVIFICFVVFLHACGNAERKTDTDKPVDKSTADTQLVIPDIQPETSVPVKPGKAPVKNGPDDVLANIDQYLVSTPSFNPSAANAEGIRGCTVSVHNKLNTASFQKAILEVSILLADGNEYRTDYYTVINIESGQQKLIKIPNTTRGVKVITHIVRVTSNELTKGEAVVVGTRYVPKQ